MTRHPGLVAHAAVRPWPAPYHAGPLDAVVRLPGSKSITNRALVLAALADGPSTIRRPLVARDSLLMVEALRQLGCGITVGEAAFDVQPAPLRGPAAVDVGLAGTVLRFVPPLAALARGPVRFEGVAAAVRRPITPLLDALRALDVPVADTAGGLPFELTGTGRVVGGAVTLDASCSSQFVSGLLLAGARYDAGLTVQHRGPALPSLPYVGLTVAMLADRGVAVDATTADRWTVRPGTMRALDLEVEPDLSTAAPFLAAAVACGGRVSVAGWPAETRQPGSRLPVLLTAYGGRVDRSADGLTLSGSGAVAPVDLDLHEVGELVPVLAALAALADGPSYLRNVAHLRGHESDRLAALRSQLGCLGATVTEVDDGLRIEPGPLRGGLFRTYGDHRLAQAGALLGLRVPDIVLDDVTVTAKTYPGFSDAWAAIVR